VLEETDMLRVVADLGNTRLKWGRLDESGRLAESIALRLDDPLAWANAWRDWKQLDPSGSWWAISTVNPPVADRLAAFLAAERIEKVTWILSAAEVPVSMDVEGAESGGSDRALVVYMAARLLPAGKPGLVVMCGTAITVERITAQGVWQGGAIAPGLGVTARALHLMTAQLPMIEIRQAPAPWGRGTQASLEAGVFWGTVGAIRELLARQTEDLGGDPCVIWTGGDAAILAVPVSGPDARIEPDLVLQGLSQIAFTAS
jgi:type III pantothenate kinase